MSRYAHTQSRVFADEVHKAHQGNVWIHEAMAIADHSMAATFSIPAREGGDVRFAGLMEVQRQMAMLQLHRQAGVPVDAVFIVDRFSLRLISQQQVPSGGTIHSHLVRTEGARGRPFVQRLAFEMPGGVAAVGKSHAKALPRALYERLRSRTTPAATGAASPRSSAERAEALTVNRRDPLLSDHESDHITAVQIIAAIENAIVGREQRALAALNLGFARYTESKPAPELVVEELPNGRFRGRVDQGGTPTATFSGRTRMAQSAEARSANA